ncbi:non-canonical purine NTP pyrophosphatase [Halomonas sp. 1513]|nr:non-canonical purine NTP pyrophosphatase [Halomonas sp. 1513]APX94194.1 non-canonical purine NTP pyrophosphatase [Halomonas sp. 1513]
MLEIRFLSQNQFKVTEARSILENTGVSVVPIPSKVEELQTEDSKRLVKDKAIKAFKQVGRPLFVEHTGLYIDYMNGLPGGLTQIFWDNLQADKFCQLFGAASQSSLEAKTIIGFIDGQKFFSFEGAIRGHVASEPRGDRSFQWDCVFVPEGHNSTFAEMGEYKHKISMRRRALDQFSEFLKNRGMV